jgi:hypothetical protein
MKKLIMLCIAIVLIAGLTSTVMAQVTLPANNAGAELVKVLTITNTTPLYFGRIGITAGQAGTVVMSTAGVRTPGALSTTIINTGTQRTVALFSLTGTTDAVYTILLPLTITVATLSGTADKDMIIDALKVKVDGAAEATAVGATGTLALGASSFLMSGTLNISATQEIGAYTGTYPITVDYQ